MKTFPNPTSSGRPLLLQWLGAVLAVLAIGASMVLGLFVFAGVAIAALLLFAWARLWVVWRRFRGKDAPASVFEWRFGSNAARSQGDKDAPRENSQGATLEGEYRVVSSRDGDD